MPYTIALIELEEGVRIMSNIINCPPEQGHVGLAVNCCSSSAAK